MDDDKLITQKVQAVCQILIEECDLDQELIEDIIYVVLDPDFHHGEYRFCGSLGMGGKLYWTRNGRFRVNAYSEDITPDRRKSIKNANARIMALEN